MGLFLQCQGQYGAFLYVDPTDHSVSGQAIGTGDVVLPNVVVLTVRNGEIVRLRDYVDVALAAAAVKAAT